MDGYFGGSRCCGIGECTVLCSYSYVGKVGKGVRSALRGKLEGESEEEKGKDRQGFHDLHVKNNIIVLQLQFTLTLLYSTILCNSQARNAPVTGAEPTLHTRTFLVPLI